MFHQHQVAGTGGSGISVTSPTADNHAWLTSGHLSSLSTLSLDGAKTKKLQLLCQKKKVYLPPMIFQKGPWDRSTVHVTWWWDDKGQNSSTFANGHGWWWWKRWLYAMNMLRILTMQIMGGEKLLATKKIFEILRNFCNCRFIQASIPQIEVDIVIRRLKRRNGFAPLLWTQPSRTDLQESSFPRNFQESRSPSNRGREKGDAAFNQERSWGFRDQGPRAKRTSPCQKHPFWGLRFRKS